MRLSNLIPKISATLVAHLDKCGIRTDTDLLFSSPIEIYRQLPSGTASLYELEQLVVRVAGLASAPGISALDMLKQETEAETRLTRLYTGVNELDELLRGFDGHRIFEISGNSYSGKTALALHAVLCHLAESPRSSAVWIDTTGDFSIDRATQFLGSCKSEAASTVLDRLQVSLVFDVEAAYHLLGDLESSLCSAKTELVCIVIDAITPLLGPLLNAVSAQGHSIMTGFMHQLRLFAQNHSCLIIVMIFSIAPAPAADLLPATDKVINNSTSSSPYSANVSTARKPALGPSFPFLTDATLWLSKISRSNNIDDNNPEDTTHTAELLRSKIVRSKSWCTFKISQGKICL